jgi:Na+-driven multidrug efflux pump
MHGNRRLPLLRQARSALCVLQELQKQARLAVPLGANLLANYSTSIISLTFLAPLGNEYIAAASLAESTYWMFGKLLVQSLCGALDTRASQVQAVESYFYPYTIDAACAAEL